jgi:hypothetical protein
MSGDFAEDAFSLFEPRVDLLLLLLRVVIRELLDILIELEGCLCGFLLELKLVAG